MSKFGSGRLGSCGCRDGRETAILVRIVLKLMMLRLLLLLRLDTLVLVQEMWVIVLEPAPFTELGTV